MSAPLWKAFYEDDVDTFRQVLEAAAAGGRVRGGVHFGLSSSHPHSSVIGSPPASALSPVLTPTLTPARTARRLGASPGGHSVGQGFVLTKADLNARDAYGRTLLHHAASATSENALRFATLLVEHPLVDLYVQDAESGWTALHRAFYFGNITAARLMLERDAGDALGKTTGHVHQTLGLVKVKDKEGLGPMDLYAATIKDRTLRPDVLSRSRAGSVASDEDRADGSDPDALHSAPRIAFPTLGADQLYTFGSNQNVTLGFGDEDDRQFPERIHLRRPAHLVRRFHREHLEQSDKKWAAYDPHHGFRSSSVAAADAWVEDLPWIARSHPLLIQDICMSKLSSAVLTTDPESNLYMCGHGKGGRLGTGDERTRFHFVGVEGGALAGKRVAKVALGLNHSLAISDEGEMYSWGSNGFGQLGYSLPRAATRDEDPISTVPRQIFGPLKREMIIGIAASRIHSVAHTSTSLFTFGKNEGQLGIVDSDARSLDMQVTPRRVAASLFTSAITAVSAIDRATICLLESHDVWVFANYGYAKVQFPLDSPSMLSTSYDHHPHRIVHVTAEGDTICALSSRGEIYTLSISHRADPLSTSASTTNPAKIRSAITTPQCIWSPKKGNMAARDVSVEADGSVVLSTEEGSVWKRMTRTTLGDAKAKDYKFSRVPALTRVLAVRSSGHGAFAAVRRDCDVLKTQLVVEDPTLWRDVAALSPLRALVAELPPDDEHDLRHRFWQGSQKPSAVALLKKAILGSADLEADLARLLEAQALSLGAVSSDDAPDAVLMTSTSDVRIPVHRFLLAGRSPVLRRALRDLHNTADVAIGELAVAEADDNHRPVIKLHGLDLLTVVDLVFYLYTDALVDFWHFTRDAPTMAHRFRQVRVELMKVAREWELLKLEPAARQMHEPHPCLLMDLARAFRDPAFFLDGDIVVQLEDDEVRVHSAVVCARCPFFEGFFRGRAGGRWLAGRGGDADGPVRVDLAHISARTFGMVLQHVYSDAGEEIFDHVVSNDLDDFLDTVMDVMGAANELMLDRLAQIAQAVVGRYVDARNVCGLLNAIAPGAVREFKDAGLEYLCLNLEAMLQGHYLNELDDELSRELDDVVRQNQLACMPFAKSGRAEALLHERHPQLAALIDRNRQARIDAIQLRAKWNDFSIGSWGDEVAASPMSPKSRRRSSVAAPRSQGAEHRPALKPKASSKDMMFEMDEESDFHPLSPRESPAIRPMIGSPRGLEPITQHSPSEETWFDARGKVLPSPRLAPQSLTPGGPATPRTPKSPSLAGGRAGTTPTGLPWTLTPLPATKTDMRAIMAQTASTSRTSSLSQGLATSAATPPAFSPPDSVPTPFSLPAPKMSQKDRKRQLHAQTAGMVLAPEPERSEPFAWKSVGSPRVMPVRQTLAREEAARSSERKGLAAVASPRLSTPSKSADPALPTRAVSTPLLTMRQTVANPKPSVPQPSTSHPLHSSPRAQPVSSPSPSDLACLGLSMSEIVAQQQLEKRLLRDAVAKRDLQEIQAEQEFQEWWDKESRRVQELESRAAGSGVEMEKGKARGARRRKPLKAPAQTREEGEVEGERKGSKDGVEVRRRRDRRGGRDGVVTSTSAADANVPTKKALRAPRESRSKTAPPSQTPALPHERGIGV